VKVWVKFIAAALVGIVLAFLLPENNALVNRIIIFLEKFFIQFGRYTAIPIVVFSLIVSIYEMREDNRFWRFLGASCLVLLVSSALVIALGLAISQIFTPQRLPILVDQTAETMSLHVEEMALSIFPSNMFRVFANSGLFILPVCVLAFYLAMGLSFDKNYTKPVLQFFDALSRIFYHIAAFFSEVLSAAIIVLSCYWMVRFQTVLQIGEYRSIMLLTGGLTLFCAVVLPVALLFLVRPKFNPFRYLYASISPAIGAFFSGDVNFSLPLALRHNKESLNIRRRANSITTPLFAVFGRAGSGMLAAVVFIVIIKSYSSLDIPTSEIVRIGIITFIISLLLCRHPGDGCWAALAVLAGVYGQGFEAGFLLVKPIAFFLVACATFIDVQITTFGSLVVARFAGMQDDKPVKNFI
jgi:Na+/H+-dicarboxylate symporter